MQDNYNCPCKACGNYTRHAGLFVNISVSIFISFMSNQKLYWPPNYACVLNRSSIDDDDRDDDDDDGGGNDGVKNN